LERERRKRKKVNSRFMMGTLEEYDGKKLRGYSFEKIEGLGWVCSIL
jgi:hypothetical protein